MARPPSPLIIREDVLKQTLDLIDEDGYESFSIPRLAKRLGVQPPSLYHHFASRAELLKQATRTVIDTVELPPFDDAATPWQEWCVRTALAMRDMILARPRVAPVVVWYLSTIGVPDLHAQSVEFLRRRGLPDELCDLVVDTLERMTVGSAGVESMRHRPRNPRHKADPPAEPARNPESREQFAASVRAFLAGVPDHPQKRSGSTG